MTSFRAEADRETEDFYEFKGYGVLLHQILYWHNMGSALVPPLTTEALANNMRWDGFFHAGV